MSAWRRFTLGLATLLGRKRGWFIPYRHAGGATRPDYGAVARLFEARSEDFVRLIDRIDAYAEDLERIGSQPPPAPRWNQDWFPALDAAALYALIRDTRPSRLVEIGSGHSTRFAARAVSDGGLATRITAIDPEPRAALAGLPVAWIGQTLQGAGLAPFQGLAAGDMVVVDSSHVLMPGSDVDLVLNAVLPALPAGVLIHVHDVFLPEDYPRAWVWRGYNEQCALPALMLGGGYEPVFASHFAATVLGERLQRSVLARLPRAAGALGASLWLRKRAAL